MRKFVTFFAPAVTTTRRRDHVVEGVGACVAVAFVTLINMIGLNQFALAVPLMAPIGASAVILFCARHSPIGRPWNVIMGNFVSALVGVGCAMILGAADYAAPIAMFLAVAAMALTRALHPPGGAVALTAVIATGPIRDAGFFFAFDPVLISSLSLVGIAAAFHHLRDRYLPARIPVGD